MPGKILKERWVEFCVSLWASRIWSPWHSFTFSFSNPFIHSFTKSVIHSLVRSSFYTIIQYSFTHSLIHDYNFNNELHSINKFNNWLWLLIIFMLAQFTMSPRYNKSFYYIINQIFNKYKINYKTIIK